jgi:hypothetical protein
MFVPYRLRDFWYEAQNKSKKYAKESALPGWNNVMIWKDFRPPYIPENI